MTTSTSCSGWIVTASSFARTKPALCARTRGGRTPRRPANSHVVMLRVMWLQQCQEWAQVFLLCGTACGCHPRGLRSAVCPGAVQRAARSCAEESYGSSGCSQWRRRHPCCQCREGKAAEPGLQRHQCVLAAVVTCCRGPPSCAHVLQCSPLVDVACAVRHLSIYAQVSSTRAKNPASTTGTVQKHFFPEGEASSYQVNPTNPVGVYVCVCARARKCASP